MASTTGPTPTLGELMQQSRILANHYNHSDLPSIQLGLDQIETQSRKLAGRAVAVPAGLGTGDGFTGTDTARAHYFLANGGVDAANLVDTIQATRVANAFEPLRPIDDTDVAGYLRHEHEQVILSALEEGRRGTQDAFTRTVDRSLRNNWEDQKRRIVEDFGSFTTPTPTAATSASLNTTQNLVAPEIAPNSLQLQAKMARYVGVVQQLNDERLKDGVYPLVHALAEQSALDFDALGTPTGIKLLESWKIVQEIVREHDVHGGQFTRGAVAQREYAPSYNDPLVYFASTQGLSLRQEIIKGSMRYLQNNFMDHVNGSIAKYPVKAQLGGKPTVRNRIAAYCRIKFIGPDNNWSADLETVTTPDGKLPIWAHIFYLLRTGHDDEALQVAVEAETYLRRNDHAFTGIFKAWLDSPDRVLPKTFRDRLFTDFNSRFRAISPDAPAIDPFKLALYKLMGRFEVRKRFPSALTSNSGNWLWLQLAMVREPPVREGQLSGTSAVLDDGGITGRDAYTLGDLASIVTTYGEAHFDPKGNSPHNYFQLLLLVGQFERAIAFLYKRAATQIEAVQFAIALTYYGLLRVPEASKTSQLEYLTVDSTSAELSAAGTPAPVGVTYFDFARLIQRYTRAFAESDPREALQHVYLVALNSDVQGPIAEEQLNRCLNMVRQVVLASKAYYALLGDPRNDGSVAEGDISKYSKLINFPDQAQFHKSVVATAAAAAERARQTKDAVLLYNLANEYDKVIAVLNKELGNNLMIADNTAALAPPTTQLSPGTSLQAASDLPTMAYEILATYEHQAHIMCKINPARRDTLHLLLKLKRAVAEYIAGDLEAALATIEATDIFPMRADVMTVTRKADEWKTADTALSMNLSELLLMTMTILSKLYAALRTSLYSDPARQRSVTDLRTKARTLLTYAGQLRLRMSTETYHQLVSLSPQ